MNYKKRIFLVLSCIFLFSISIIVLNIFINPYGFYGKKQKKIQILNARRLKLNFIEKSNVNYEAFVLGSSNSMRFNPELIEKKTKLKAYNYGVFYATAEDYYVLPKLLFELETTKPKLILFCLDVFSFRKVVKTHDEVFEGARNRLSYFPRASKYLNDYSDVKLNWFRLKSALTFEQTSISLNALYDGNLTNLSFTESYASAITNNGCRKKYANFEGKDITDIAEKGDYQISKYIERKDIEFLKARNGYKGIVSVTGNYDFEGLSNRRLRLFEKTIEYLSKKECKVVINIMPVEPYFYSLLTKRTKHIENVKELTTFCNYLKRKYPNIAIVKDNSQVDSFKGLNNHFFDQYHPTYKNSNLMIESLKLDQMFF